MSTTLQFNNNDNFIQGYWSPSTSSVDWCELNYQHSTYVAETFNTFTAIFYIFAAFIFQLQFKKINMSIPFRFYFMNLIFIGVALGTILFHATLKRSAQLMDEFPMIYGVSIVFYCLVCNEKDTSNFRKYFFGFICSLFSIVMTILMIYYPKNPSLFFITFAVVAFITYFTSLNYSLKIEGGLQLWIESAIIILFSFLVWVIKMNHFNLFLRI
eukprot:gene978-9885_t